jgi:hypothetical protein
MEPNRKKLESLAKDLRREEPRYGNDELAGFKGAARCLDKCRATLLGWHGDFMYGCPLDQMFFREAGIDANKFKNLVATGATDSEVEDWLREHARAARAH